MGPKRRGLTDGGGVPSGLAVAGAHRHDVTMVQETRTSLPGARPMPTPEKPQGMGLDTGDACDEGRELLATCGFTAHSRARGEEAQASTREAGSKARRWVGESSHL
jgi:hypothetical protein